jgi:hypothetical protein
MHATQPRFFFLSAHILHYKMSSVKSTNAFETCRQSACGQTTAAYRKQLKLANKRSLSLFMDLESGKIQKSQYELGT